MEKNLLDDKEPLKSIKPDRLINKNSNDRIDDLFLALGIFFNDFKSLTFCLKNTDLYFNDIDQEEVSIPNGERGGTIVFIERSIIASIHEFLVLIEKNIDLIKKPGGEFNFLLSKTSPDVRERWINIINLAYDNKASDSSILSKVLLLIRNNISYHISTTNIRKGYLDFFFNDDKNIFNNLAYYRIGDKMKDTRFYYCDGAIKRAIKTLVEEKMSYKEYSESLSGVLSDINVAISSIMKIYIKER